MKEFINLFFSYRIIGSLLKDPIFCRHRMKYWDMKWFVDSDHSDPNYRRFNGKVWKNTFCECQKCGVQKRKSMKVGDWGKWKNHSFTPTSNGIIEVEIYPYGPETKRQKRDRLINEILSNC
jgi:hypothetical protein